MATITEAAVLAHSSASTSANIEKREMAGPLWPKGAKITAGFARQRQKALGASEAKGTFPIVAHG